MGNEILQEHINKDYEWGFVTDIEAETFKKGLSEDVIRMLSNKKTSQSGCWKTD